MGKITNEDSKAYTLKISKGAVSSTSSIGSKTTITNVLVSTASYKIQVVGGGSCECTGKANVYIRKGVPIPEEPKVKEVKPKPEEKKPAPFSKSSSSSKPASKPATTRAARASTAEENISDDEQSELEVESEGEEEEAVMDSGYGPVSIAVLRQNRRAFWENRAEWGGETTPKEWNALTKLLYASGNNAVREFEEFLDLCTKGEDGWRILVHVAPHVPGVSPDDIRVLLIDWAITGPSGYHTVRVILRKMYMFMLRAATSGQEQLAQKLRLGCALLVHRHIAISGVTTFLQNKLYNWPEASMFPCKSLANPDIENNKFKFLEPKSESQLGVLLSLWSRCSNRDYTQFEFPEEKEILYLPNVLHLSMVRSAKYGSIFYFDYDIMSWAMQDPCCRHLMKTGSVAWLVSLKLRFQRVYTSFFEDLPKKTYWNDFLLPLIRETSGAEDQLMQVISELISSWPPFTTAIKLMASAFNLSEDKIKAAKEKRARRAEFDFVTFTEEQPWGGRVPAPRCFEVISRIGPTIVLDYNFEQGPTIRKLENKLRRTPLNDGWGPVDVEVLVERKDVFWSEVEEWGGATPHENTAQYIDLLYQNGDGAIKAFDDAIIKHLTTISWRIACQVNQVLNPGPPSHRLLLLDRCLVSTKGIYMAQVILRKVYLSCLLMRKRGDIDDAQNLRLLSALLVYRVIEANGIPAFFETNMHTWPECSFFPIEKLREPSAFKFTHVGGLRAYYWDLMLRDNILEVLKSERISAMMLLPQIAGVLLVRWSKFHPAPTFPFLDYLMRLPKFKAMSETGNFPFPGVFQFLMARGKIELLEQMVGHPTFESSVAPELRKPQAMKILLEQLAALPFQQTFDKAAALMTKALGCTATQIEDAKKAKERKPGSGGLKYDPQVAPFGITMMPDLEAAIAYCKEKLNKPVLAAPNLEDSFGKHVAKILGDIATLEASSAPAAAPALAAMELPKQEQQKIEEEEQKKPAAPVEQPKEDPPPKAISSDADLDLDLDLDSKKEKKPMKSSKDKKDKKKSKAAKSKEEADDDLDVDDMLDIGDIDINDIDIDDLELNVDDDGNLKPSSSKKPPKPVTLTDADLDLDL